MKKKSPQPSAFSDPRVFISFVLLFGAALLAFVAFGVSPASTAQAQGAQQNLTAGQLTPEEAQAMAEALKPLINNSTEGLVQIHRPDGSVGMDLQGRFQNVAVAKKLTNGGVSQSCVNDPDAAAAFFGIDRQLLGPVSKDQPKPVDR